MDPPPAPLQSNSNDDDPAVAAPEPYLPLMNDDDDLTEPSPVVPFPPPKEPSFDLEQPYTSQRYSCPPPPFNNNSYRFLNGSAPPPNFSNFYNISNGITWDDDCSFGAAPPPDFSNSYNMSNPHPPDQSSALPQQKKKGRNIFSRIGQKSSSNNNLDLKGHVVVKVRTTPADTIKLENNSRIIPEEEAVCRFCFHQLFLVNNDHNNNNNDNVLETKCLCPFTLTHEQCATEWSGKKGNTKCDVCDQDTIYIPVTLSTPPCTSQEKPDNSSSISTLEKWSCFGTGFNFNIQS